jgi:HAD superfamily hydrolase (TIGR01509 family)
MRMQSIRPNLDAANARRSIRPKDAANARPDVEAVLFDYGRTLVTFDYPTDDLLAVLERFRPRIEQALGAPAPAADALLRDVLVPLEEHIDSPDQIEITYTDVYRATWRKAGLDLPGELLHEILDAEQQCWDRAVQVDPDVVRVLSWLKERGIKRAVCSNAPFPPEMMHRQVASNGIAQLMDVVLFSSQFGRRKPAPEIYRAALESLGVSAERSLFVGDRVREDYEGPRAIGMRAILCTAHASEMPPPGIPTISSLGELPAVL